MRRTASTPDPVAPPSAEWQRFIVEQRRQGLVLDRIVELLQRGRGPRDGHDVALVVGIVASISARTFVCDELIEHAKIDPSLAAVLTAADVVTAFDLGILFRRLRDRPIGGFVLERVDRYDRRGKVWRVRLCEGGSSHHRPD